ncbi:MAG: ribonuclease III [Gammaproteobacteria bacterium]|nr:ribonuclease III [Gammaproteobacteria bacterium]
MIVSIDLQKKLHYTFKNESLLTNALTHRSIGNNNNERLEFLGDSLLNCIIAEVLFHKFPQATEGELSRMRANLVKQESLAMIARDLELGNHIRLGTGELKSGGWRRDSILADAVEAIIAAIYLDTDFLACQTTVLIWFENKLANITEIIDDKDAKTKLQEYLQARKLALPIYELLKTEGLEHNQIFYVWCRVPDLNGETEGHGQSRRHAEQMAAEKYLQENAHDIKK